LEKTVKKTISFQKVWFLTSILTRGMHSCEKVSGRTDDSLFPNLLQSSSDRAEAKLQFRLFLANLAVSRRDRLFFSFSCLFRQQQKRDCLWQRASLDQLVNNLKSAIALNFFQDFSLS
jgi:hypothetical protein